MAPAVVEAGALGVIGDDPLDQGGIDVNYAPDVPMPGHEMFQMSRRWIGSRPRSTYCGLGVEQAMQR
jgi:hypothetical protein